MQSHNTLPFNVVQTVYGRRKYHVQILERLFFQRQHKNVELADNRVNTSDV